MKTNRLSLAVLFVFAVTTTSLAAPLGMRFAPSGTFRGDARTLIAIARNTSAIQACYDSEFGDGWKNPNNMEFDPKPIEIPDGALVPHNAILTRDGKVIYRNTYQKGKCRAYRGHNKKSGKDFVVKDCGQPMRPELEKGWEKQQTFYETDIEARAASFAEATATATASSTSNAWGGNATLIFNNPQPRFIPQQRVLSTTGRETNVIGGICWVIPTKINNKISINNTNVNTNNLHQEQNQDQAQAQAQSQAQALANSIGIGGFINSGWLIFPLRRRRRKQGDNNEQDEQEKLAA